MSRRRDGRLACSTNRGALRGQGRQQRRPATNETHGGSRRDRTSAKRLAASPASESGPPAAIARSISSRSDSRCAKSQLAARLPSSVSRIRRWSSLSPHQSKCTERKRSLSFVRNVFCWPAERSLGKANVILGGRQNATARLADSWHSPQLMDACSASLASREVSALRY